MKSREIVGCFFSLFIIVAITSFYTYSKKTVTKKTGIIEYKLDATYNSSSTMFVFRLVNGVEIFDVKVSVGDYNHYNKGDEFTYKMITHINNIALTIGIISVVICIIILIIYFAD